MKETIKIDNADSCFFTLAFKLGSTKCLINTLKTNLLKINLNNSDYEKISKTIKLLEKDLEEITNIIGNYDETRKNNRNK